MSLVWCLDRTWRDATGPGAFGCIWGVGDSRLSNVYIAHSHTQSLKFQKELNMKTENPRIGEVTIPETDWVKSCVLMFFLVQKVFRDVRPDYEQFWTLGSSNRRCVLMKISAMVACRTLSNRGTARNLGTKPTTHLDIVALQDPGQDFKNFELFQWRNC